MNVWIFSRNSSVSTTNFNYAYNFWEKKATKTTTRWMKIAFPKVNTMNWLYGAVCCYCYRSVSAYMLFGRCKNKIVLFDLYPNRAGQNINKEYNISHYDKKKGKICVILFVFVCVEHSLGLWCVYDTIHA